MQPNSEWTTGPTAWAEFVAHHPELGYRPGRWQFHNFLRYYRADLVQCDAIRRARKRLWVAHRVRFMRSCFDLATGAGQGQIEGTPAVGPTRADSVEPEPSG